MADNTLINMLMGAWPGGASPVFGVQTPQEQGLQQPSILDNAASSMINSAATLPQRAIQNSQFALNTGAYDPGPTLEAAMLPMGASPFGTGAEGSAVFGAGPIKAYHGSPHDFDAFSMDKIGTGEGAQAYGHGLYFADNEGVAKSYRDALAPQPLDGKMVEDLLAKHGGDRNAALSDLATQEAAVANPRAAGMFQSARDMIEGKAPTRPGHMYEVNINADPAHFLDYDSALAADHPARAKLKELAQMGLDSHESGVDRQLAKDAFVAADNPNLTGNGLYRQMTNAVEAARPKLKEAGNPRALFGGTAPLANEQLTQAGIPGIKYLDQGSRLNPAVLPDNPMANEARQFLEQSQGDADKALKAFNGSAPHERWATTERDEIRNVIKQAATPISHNYVVFNDKLIDIMRKYGLAGVLPASGVAGAAMSPVFNQQSPVFSGPSL